MSALDLSGEQNQRKIQIIILSLIFGVLFGLGLWINLRPGIYVWDEFLYRKSAEVYQRGENAIEVQQSDDSFFFDVRWDGEEKTATLMWSETSSPYGDKKVTITFDDNEVIEGVWGRNDDLLGEDGLPIWWDSGVIISVSGEQEPIGNTVLAEVLCKIAFGETEKFGSVLAMVLGAFFMLGMLPV